MGEQLIPALSLQNAIDYFVRTQNAPLHLRIGLVENQVCLSCDHLPKALSFDGMDNDRHQLENNGAYQKLEGEVTIFIPFFSNSTAI